MPTPWLPGPQLHEVGASDGALSRLEKFMDSDVPGSLKAKSGGTSGNQSLPSSDQSTQSHPFNASTVPPLVQQYPVEARSVPEVSPQGTNGSEEAVTGDHESESDMEIQTVFLGSDGRAPDKAPLGNGLPKSSIQDERQNLQSRSTPSAGQEETNTVNFGSAFSASSWVSQVVTQESSAFASQNLKYMKALNDPYVKALAAHRRELNASRIDLEREYVDTMASKLSTQRSGALATLNVRGEGRGRHAPAYVPPENNGRCQCYGLDNSICENETKEAENEKVVMVPYYASAHLPAEDTTRSAASSAFGPTTGRMASAEDLLSEERPATGSSWSMPWLSSMSNKIPALPDVLSVMVGAEPLHSARQQDQDPQRQIPLSELIDGMETQL